MAYYNANERISEHARRARASAERDTAERARERMELVSERDRMAAEVNRLQGELAVARAKSAPPKPDHATTMRAILADPQMRQALREGLDRFDPPQPAKAQPQNDAHMPAAERFAWSIVLPGQSGQDQQRRAGREPEPNEFLSPSTRLFANSLKLPAAGGADAPAGAANGFLKMPAA